MEAVALASHLYGRKDQHQHLQEPVLLTNAIAHAEASRADLRPAIDRNGLLGGCIGLANTD